MEGLGKLFSGTCVRFSLPPSSPGCVPLGRESNLRFYISRHQGAAALHSGGWGPGAAQLADGNDVYVRLVLLAYKVSITIFLIVFIPYSDKKCYHT